MKILHDGTDNDDSDCNDDGNDDINNNNMINALPRHARYTRHATSGHDVLRHVAATARHATPRQRQKR
jgi:hypothetical protein